MLLPALGTQLRAGGTRWAAVWRVRFCGKSLDFFYKRIRRRREPPFQSFPCRTDRKGRFAGGGSHQFNHFHAELATGQIRRRREPPIQSLPCRTDRKGRFAGGGSRQFNHFHAELATGQIRRRREPPIQSFPCRTGHRPDLFVPDGTHGKKRGTLVPSKSDCW